MDHDSIRHLLQYLVVNLLLQFTAVCEHCLLIVPNMLYGLFSMQHGSFELSDSQTRVLHNE